MQLPLQLNDCLYYLGVLDANLRTFDIIMTTEFGTTYNAYALKSRGKTVLFETVKDKFFDEYLENLQKIVNINDVEYLVVSHTEPDHAGSVERLLELRPDLKIIASAAAVGFLKQIVNRDFVGITVKDGDEIEFGEKTLKFICAPNLHWPDTIYTYIPQDETLITCDSFGSHYAFDGILRSAVTNTDEYMRATKAYFDPILGPFKSFMLKALDKVEKLPLKLICPGHGPIIDNEIPEFLRVYRGWSALPEPNKKPLVVIPYVTAYGYTQMMAEKIAKGVADAGDLDVRLHDLTGKNAEFFAKVAAELAACDGFLLGTPTILGEALEPIWELTLTMFPGTHGGKLAGAFGSYGWTGEGVPNITERLKMLKLNVVDGFRVRFKPAAAEQNDAYEYGYDFGCRLLKKENPRKRGSRQLVKCLVCGEIFDSAIDTCPVCGVGRENFVTVSEDELFEVKSTQDRYVIVGGGVAALSALKEIRRRDKTCQITLITDEPYLPYSRPMLTKTMAAGIKPEHLLLENAEFYSGCKVYTNTRVTAVDVSAKTVKFGENEINYDKLIIATGAECFVPPFKGAENANVFSIRKISDTDKIYAALPNVKSAVVIGGGVLGLEAAWELRKLKLDVTVIETAPYLLQRSLDSSSADVLNKIAAAKGIRVITGAGVSEIKGDGKATGVELADGTLIECQMVIVSTGVRANVGLAKAAGCAVNRAIVVDEHMATSVADIYAAGDCAEFNDVNLSLWGEASDQGKIAGAAAVGADDIYVPTSAALTFSGFDTMLFAVGDTGKNSAHAYKTISVDEQCSSRFRKFFYLNGRLQGAVTIGSGVSLAALTEAVDGHISGTGNLL